MPKDERKCRMYIARITHRAAERAAARVTWLKVRNKERYEHNQTPRRFTAIPATLIGGALRTFGNPFAGSRKHRSDGVARTVRLYKRRYAGGAA